MVNYPNKKKNNHYTSMIEGKHNTAHRGMNLEEDINLKMCIRDSNSTCKTSNNTSWNKRNNFSKLK